MARPIWKGALSFGLVTVPVGLYSAVESKNELSFRMLHGKDKSPIDYRRVCEEEEVEVPWSEIVKGYEYEKDKFVVITEKDFEKARVPATQTFEIRDFVPARAIDFIYFDHPYYLAPAGKTGVKAYALLRDALKETERVGVGTIVLRQREHLAALEPSGDALVLTTMRFSYEIRSPQSLDLPKATEGAAKREMALARQLVETLAADWDPKRYKDTYHEVLLHVIQQKIEGKEVSIPAPEKPPKVTSLVKALQASLAKAPSRRAAGERHAAGDRRAAGPRRVAPHRRRAA
jgi:DNA end-binding protein Ku